MQVPIINRLGQPTGQTTLLADDVFGIEPNDHAIYQDVRLIQANARQGTHKTKSRGEVRGSTKKPFKQKGTGNARQGHKRSPLFRHGGTIFGPQPHTYEFKLNKKVKRLARRSALSYKAQQNQVTVLDSLSFEAPKTKAFAEVMENLKHTGRKVLVVLPALDRQIAAQAHQEQVVNVHLSGRNLPQVQITSVADLNTLDILDAESLVLMKDAVATLNTLLSEAI